MLLQDAQRANLAEPVSGGRVVVEILRLHDEQGRSPHGDATTTTSPCMHDVRILVVRAVDQPPILIAHVLRISSTKAW
jgi:hypothetical protein